MKRDERQDKPGVAGERQMLRVRCKDRHVSCSCSLGLNMDFTGII